MPLVLPSVTGGALIAFMMSLSNFGTPMIIGGNYLVLPTLAYNLFTSEIRNSVVSSAGERPRDWATLRLTMIE